MEKKLIIYMLVLCLAFSFGAVQAQAGEENKSQWGNLNTGNNITTLADKTANLSEGSGGDVRWIPVSENETTFYTIQETAAFSGNFTRINGTCFLNLTDLTPMDVNQSDNTSKAEFNFTDPTGKIKYGVILKNIAHVAGFISMNSCIIGNSPIDECMKPTVYSYGAVWGVGELYVNGTLVNDNRVIRVMANERVNSSDKEGDKLLFDKELPHKGIETRLLLPEMVANKNGTIEKRPVPTNYTLPDGQSQSFINVIFKDSQLEGRKIFNL